MIQATERFVYVGNIIPRPTRLAGIHFKRNTMYMVLCGRVK